MPDNHYQDRKLAEIYDLDSGWGIDRDFYLALASPQPQNILDLGCGTGLICDAYAARGHNVTGLDPAAAMLDVARQKPHGKKIDWVQAFAQDYNTDKLFDLIIMTGHAFQTLLEDKDILAAFAMMQKHLKPQGRVVFESRNPAIDWAKTWNYEIELQTPYGTVHEARQLLAMDGKRMHFELRYRFPDETLVSTSELRFSPRNEITKYLNASGLQVEKCLGDWDGKDFDEAASQEMIFIVFKA